MGVKVGVIANRGMAKKHWWFAEEHTNQKFGQSACVTEAHARGFKHSVRRTLQAIHNLVVSVIKVYGAVSTRIDTADGCGMRCAALVVAEKRAASLEDLSAWAHCKKFSARSTCTRGAQQYVTLWW